MRANSYDLQNNHVLHHKQNKTKQKTNTKHVKCLYEIIQILTVYECEGVPTR